MLENRKARRRRLTERLEALRDRVILLEQELTHYTNDFFRVCIFGSARIKPEDALYQTTRELGILFGKEGIDVLTGGGQGLMEAANIGTKEGRTLTNAKSKSFGITIELNRYEKPSDHLDIRHHHKRFSSRLDDFMRLSNAIVVVPGGIGTALELFFSWQLLQLSHITERPVILLDSKFWEGLIKWMREEMIARGLVYEKELRWIHLVDTPQQAFEIVKLEHQKFLQKKQDDV